MLEYLNFQICKPNSSSRFIKIEVMDDAVYMTTAYGYQGMYASSSFIHYYSPIQSAWLISELLKDLKIYSWPKAIPADYTPGNYLIGCDIDSWSLHYRDQGKKRTRHIYGKGSFPATAPYDKFLKCIDHISPKKDWLAWLADNCE